MKKVLIILISFFILIGCGSKNIENNKYRNNLVDNIGVTNNNKIVIKFKLKNKVVYNIYTFKKDTYDEVQYIFYSSKDYYNKDKARYSKDSKFNFKTYDKAYVISINLLNNSKKDKNTYNEIINKYKKKKYEIVK